MEGHEKGSSSQKQYQSLRGENPQGGAAEMAVLMQGGDVAEAEQAKAAESAPGDAPPTSGKTLASGEVVDENAPPQMTDDVGSSPASPTHGGANYDPSGKSKNPHKKVKNSKSKEGKVAKSPQP
jgi:hypothetical protein